MTSACSAGTLACAHRRERPCYIPGGNSVTNQQPTLEEAKVIAARAGLPLTEAELQDLLPGLARAKGQIADLRAIIAKTDEPAGVFDPKAGGAPIA